MKVQEFAYQVAARTIEILEEMDDLIKKAK